VQPLVVVEAVRRVYRSGSTEVHALRGISFTVAEGTLLAVKGRSGSGKTTLLNCIGGLDQPDGGRVVVAGADVTGLDEKGLLALRRETIGFVFQSFGLVPILSAAENVGVPLRLLRADPGDRDRRVSALLDLVGLSEQTQQRPYELSGGQQQRVAIARALANSPRLIIADEPTGQLDSQTGLAVMQLLQNLVRTQGVTAIVATHDPVLLGYADDVLELSDGALVEGEPNVA
jgi:putative ABC transport system ATP-binding protein